MQIEIDDLTRSQVHALLDEHLQAMYALSPPESVHALDLDKLRQPGIVFWSAWEDQLLLGCGALKQLSAEHGEVKSMRTASAHLRQGVGRALLRHIESTARAKGIQRLSLETGPHAPFVAAQKLYGSEGFVECGPFADYVLDPYSLFMTKRLTDGLPLP